MAHDGILGTSCFSILALEIECGASLPPFLVLYERFTQVDPPYIISKHGCSSRRGIDRTYSIHTFVRGAIDVSPLTPAKQQRLATRSIVATEKAAGLARREAA